MSSERQLLNLLVKLVIEAAVTAPHAASEDYALARIVHRQSTTLILYSPVELERCFEKVPGYSQTSSYKKDRFGNPADVIIGIIDFGDSTAKGFAWGAKMVHSSAAKRGYGPLMYDIAMEEAGKLMSDRAAVSSNAERVWQAYKDKRNDVEKWKLDDIDNPKTPPNIDDTKVFPDDRDALNYAYELEHDVPGVGKLFNNHQKELQKLETTLGAGAQNYVIKRLDSLADEFFLEKYDDTFDKK